MVSFKRMTIGLAAGCVVLAQGAQAQDLEFDAAFSYAARNTVTVPGTDDNSDNDIMRLTTGLSWDVSDGRMRAALELGAMNEYFDGNYTGAFGGELVFGRRVGNQRYSLGGRLRYSEDLSTTTEISYTAEHFGSLIDWRGMVGAQFIADADKVRGRSDASAFGLGEANFFFNENWALTAGLQADSDGEAYILGTEYRPRNTGFSLFLEWGSAFDNYRDVDNYNDLVGGIRYVPKATTLRGYRRSNLGRVMQRVLEVQ